MIFIENIILYYDDLEFEDKIEYKIYLLRKYLNKHYDEAAALSLLKSNSGKLDILAKALGRKDIAFYCEYFLSSFFVPNSASTTIRPLSKTHYEIFEELNEMFAEDKWDKEEFILPRGLGKSTVINKALGCWAHCYKLSRYTCVIGKTESDATGFIGDTKQMLMSADIVATFGVLVDQKTRTVNVLELELTNDTKLMAWSSGSSIRGTTYGCSEGIFRPSIIIVDDFISENDILSDNAKQKIVDKYYKEILESGDKANFDRHGNKIQAATKFLVIGTPLASDDFIATIKEDSEFYLFHRSVLAFNPDEYFTQNEYWLQYKSILMNIKNKNRLKDAEAFFYDHVNEMTFERLWNEKWSCVEIANKYYTKRLSFMQELMCDCEKVGDIWIKYMAKMKAYEIEEKKHEKTVMSIDQSASNNIKSDFSAFTILSKSNGFYLVRKGSLRKFDSKTEFDKYIDYVEELLLEFTEITHVILEKNVYKGVDATRIEERIRNNPNLSSRGIVVLTVYNTKNKDQRIMTITEKINSGQVIFNENDKEYNDQVHDFRGQNYSLHDDAIDSLEMAINNIDEIEEEPYLEVTLC